MMKNRLLITTAAVLACHLVDFNSAYYHRRYQINSPKKIPSNLLTYCESEACKNEASKPTPITNNVSNQDKAYMERLQKMKPHLNGYVKVDESFVDENMKALFNLQDHALHDTLNGPNMIEVYEVYKKIDEDEIVCLVKFGKSLNGYPGIVHGGITALLFDNTFGWVFLALRAPHGVTANLNINYRYELYIFHMCLLNTH